VAKSNEQSNAADKFQSIDRVDWNARLARNNKDELLPVLDNVVSILRNDQRWSGVIAFDEMGGRVMKLKPPPFERGEAGEWMDIDDARLEHWLAVTYQLRRMSSDTISKGVLLAADEHRYHEVRDYLDGLKWDGRPRVDTWLSSYLGATHSKYMEAVGTKWLVGAVARASRPGVKMDNVLILEGEQGLGKSTALKVLFSPWFTDAAFELGSTDGYQIMRGMWCVELAELDGFNRAEASRSKAFFTRSEDRYRNPYGRKPVTIQRTGVFGGSVNHGTYLKDDTGNRRYWPVKVGRMNMDDLIRDRDQLWAEARDLFKAGHEWWVRASDRLLYETEQDARYIGDTWESLIMNWLSDKQKNKDGVYQFVDYVRTDEVMRSALHLDIAKHSPAEQARVGKIMARIGWKRQRETGGVRDWFYVRPGKDIKDRPVAEPVEGQS
jgi:putative DNA primase/helicase